MDSYHSKISKIHQIVIEIYKSNFQLFFLCHGIGYAYRDRTPASPPPHTHLLEIDNSGSIPYAYRARTSNFLFLLLPPSTFKNRQFWHSAISHVGQSYLNLHVNYQILSASSPQKRMADFFCFFGRGRCLEICCKPISRVSLIEFLEYSNTIVTSTHKIFFGMFLDRHA